MATSILRFVSSVYHELGFASIHATGRNAYIVIICRSFRMFAHGAVTLILAPFLSSLGVTESSIGLFLTLTLFGDVFLGLFLTLIADRLGRRRVLLIGSAMMMGTGVTFAVSSSYWILLLAAIFGVVSATGTDFGPFRSIEESINSEITNERTRPDVFTWYIVAGMAGSGVGSEVCGRMVHWLGSLDGWSVGDACKVVFWIYMMVGMVNAALTVCLGEECEMQGGSKQEMYQRVVQNEDDREITEVGRLSEDLSSDEETLRKRRPNRSWPTSLSTISPPTLEIVWKLWALLAVDSFAEGLATYALTIYYMDQKFQPDKSLLGDVTSVAYFLSAASSIFAGSLARRFGLVNTMVFSHVPSSAAMLLYPLPSSFVLTVMSLFVRTGLNNLDQAPRGAFIAAVSRPDERTAVLGIAGMVRTVAAMPGPWLTGVLASQDLFGYAFILAGSIRLAYDFGLFVTFSKMDMGRPRLSASASDA